MNDFEHPRDPQRVRLDPVQSKIVEQIFSWYVDLENHMSLDAIAQRLDALQIPTPQGADCWNIASLNLMLKNPVYTGIAQAGRKRQVRTQRRQSALKPIGPGLTRRLTATEEWIPVSVPALITQEVFDQAQQRLERNKQMARRNNQTHDYLLRGLISCASCRLTWAARTNQTYGYYTCTGRNNRRLEAQGGSCQIRSIRSQDLDTLIWNDLVQILKSSELITHQLHRAQAGEWLPQVLQSRIQTLQHTLHNLENQQIRLLDVFLAQLIERHEFERKHHDLQQTHHGIQQQLLQLQKEAQKQINTTQIAQGLNGFCQRIQNTLENLSFSQRRQLVELLIDRVLVDEQNVEIRYVIPTSPKGEDFFLSVAFSSR